MVTLPPPFTATKFPGYFWNVETKKLYSLKVCGELREMHTLNYPNRFNRLTQPCYGVSHRGVRKSLPLAYLHKLKIEDSEIPLQGANR